MDETRSERRSESHGDDGEQMGGGRPAEHQ